MDLRSRLYALQAGEPASNDSTHSAVDAVLRALAAEDLQILRDILDRWEAAGHPAGSVPSSSDLEPTDTGIVVDPDTKTLIATPPEWEVFERVVRQLG
jgi:hypothetical protein